MPATVDDMVHCDIDSEFGYVGAWKRVEKRWPETYRALWLRFYINLFNFDDSPEGAD